VGRVKLRHPNSGRWFSEEENAQLMRLVNDAFDLRETPYSRDAAEAIVDWSERTRPDRLERHAGERSA
jgi:hypothetical protein